MAAGYAARRGMQAMQNPKNRSYAKQIAKQVALRTLSRVNRRRRSRGRRVWLPAERFGYGQRMEARALMAPPVRNNAAVSSFTKDERVTSSEICNFQVTSDLGDENEPAHCRLTPSDESIWPALAQKAKMYTAYTVIGLRFNYYPNVGSNYNGQIAMAFTDNAEVDNTSFKGSPDLLGTSCNVTANAGQACTLVIGPSQMSLRGRDLAMPRGDITVQDVLKYYIGSFFWMAYNCEDHDQVIGRIEVKYDLILKKQRVDSAALVTAIGQTGMLVGGFGSPQDIEATTTTLGFSYATRRNACLLVRLTCATTPTVAVTVNGGAALTPTLATYNGNNFTYFYDMGRRIGRSAVAVTSSVATITKVALIPCDPAHLT